MLDVAVNGESIYSTVLHNSYDYKTGTSQSAAIVTAMTALIKSYKTSISSSELLQLYTQTASSEVSSTTIVPNPEALLAEFGISEDVNIEEAPILSSVSDIDVVINQLLNAPNPVRESFTTFYFNSLHANLNATIKLYSLSGQKMKEGSSTTIIGQNTIRMELDNLNNGSYIYVLEVDGLDNIQKGICQILR